MPKPATFDKPKIDLPASEDIARPYTDKELEVTPEMAEKLNKLLKFFAEHGIDYGRFDPSNKKAYPNYDQFMHIPGQRDTKKWLETVKTLYYKEKNGTDRVMAIRQATSGWNPVETYDFLNWLKFYEEGAHMKYKFAQVWYENGAPGYFLHIKPDAPVEEPHVSGPDMDSAKDAEVTEMSKAEKKNIIEKQRNKIIGRLDSAEKLLRSPEGQMFAGPELENLMETIFSLKKKVQLVNKLSTSIRLYEDMIIREANVLSRRGFFKAADVLHSIAQANNPPPAGLGTQKDTPLSPVSPGDPAGPGHPGAPGGLPSTGPGMPQNAPSSATPESVPNEMSPSNPKTPGAPAPTAAASPPPPMPQTPPGISGFLHNMETSNLTSGDKSAAGDLEVMEADTDLVVEAQMVPPPTPSTEDVPLTTEPGKPPAAPVDPAVMAPATETPLEVTEDDIPVKKDKAPSPDASNFDSKVDAAFEGVQISDVVAKLEDLSTLFKNRDIPRQISVVDMMLDSLGLASYFPSLSEAHNKALESNNYISTRIDDILSKLRGAISTKEPGRGPGAENPEVDALKGKLQKEEESERNRKQMKKDQESAELSGKGGPAKETPAVEINEDLGGKAPAAAPRPTPVVTPPPARPLG